MAEALDPMHHNDPVTPPKKIGDFEILKSLGKGGMGEVFVAYDRLCERKIALKRIRPELSHHKTIKERFLREARFASKLSHPCVIPIYGIYEENDVFYYTMPYVEGETLKEIFKNTILKEQNGEPPHEIGVSIPSLTRIFHLVCQALAFAHSKFILHRDIKPENIIVGQFGEVFILDWGIAGYLNEKDINEEPVPLLEDKEDLTRPGKVFGTINYMAPERALKEPASIQTEIYSLGIILYQILTLNFPFKRKSLQHFRKTIQFETLVLPEEIAPYRDIPKQLSKIVQKALSPDPKNRYQRIDELLFDLENYIEGKPEWILNDELDIKKKDDWEFQENVLMTKHLALTRVINDMQWAILMISKKSHLGNIRIEFDIHFPFNASGIGVLLCIPEPSERTSLEDGYCLWIGGPHHPYSTLFRTNAEVMSIPSNGIQSEKASRICIEKIENSVRLFVDGNIKLQYVSHIPIVGSFVGIVYKDPDFHISPILIHSGSQQIMINCLSIPDAFLANKNFVKAYSEYKRISYSFHGRVEGREAIFRAGLTLTEQAKRATSKEEKKELLSQAMDEFETLRATPGAPLEYLGKSLVYHLEHEADEEIKCLELALRKYPKHPLLCFLKEHIIFRLHESSTENRYTAYNFLLLTLRHLPEIFSSYEHQRLLEHLMKSGEPLYFMEGPISFSDKNQDHFYLCIQIAFWLCKPITLVEMLYNIPSDGERKIFFLSHILFCLIKLHCFHLVRDKLVEFEQHLTNFHDKHTEYDFLLLNLLTSKEPVLKKLELFFQLIHKESVQIKEIRIFEMLLEPIDDQQQLLSASHLIHQLYQYISSDKTLLYLKSIHLPLLLKQKDLISCDSIFATLDKEKLTDPKTDFFIHYGIYLWVKKGQDTGKAHFQLALDAESLPIRTAATYFLKPTSDLSSLSTDALVYETIQIFRYLELFYAALDKPKKAQEFKKYAEQVLEYNNEIAKISSIDFSN